MPCLGPDHPNLAPLNGDSPRLRSSRTSHPLRGLSPFRVVKTWPTRGGDCPRLGWLTFGLLDVHPRHEAGGVEGVDVDDRAFGQQGAVVGMDGLGDGDGDAAVGAGGEGGRLDGRGDLGPLALPVGPDLLLAGNAASLPAVGPVDVGHHRGQDPVGVAGVERRVHRAQQLLVRAHARSLYPRTNSRWLTANSAAVAAVRNSSDSAMFVSE